MPQLLSEMIRFVGVGGVATIAHYSVLIALVELAGVDSTIGALAGFIAGGIVSYTLNYRWTFRSERDHAQAAPRFFSIAAVGFVLTGILMEIFTDHLHIPYLLAQMMTTGMVIVWHYLGNKLWTFRESGK